MDKLVYIAMSGARQTMLEQGTNNHNLANLNTTGFKAQMDMFKALPVYGPGHASRAYTQTNQVGSRHDQGSLINTGNPLDIAVNGPGFISVQDSDGSEAYTRAGDLRLSAQGILETSGGFPVLGNGGPITLSAYDEISIGSDGTITIRPLGQSRAELAVLDRIKLVNPDTAGLKRNDRGLFVNKDGTEAVADSSVSLIAESLEASNVNSVEALVNMIELSRQYETQVKLMAVAEENDAAANRLLQPT